MNEALITTLLGSVPEFEQFLRVLARMVAAVVLGSIIGIQRELTGKPAGVRTHALVTLAAAIFTLIPIEAGMLTQDLSRVLQGITTGIGFIGAGVILKLHSAREVIGLTTAATIWAATAVGVAVGLGQVVLAALGVGLIWIVLSTFTRLDAWVAGRQDD